MSIFHEPEIQVIIIIIIIIIWYDLQLLAVAALIAIIIATKINSQLVEHWTCNWKVAHSNSRIGKSLFDYFCSSAQCAVIVFPKRHKTETLSQSANSAD